jgi:signal transduction histidine kinase
MGWSWSAMSASSVPAKPDADDRYERLLEVQALMARANREIGPAIDLGHVLRSVVSTMRSLVSFRGGGVCLLGTDGIRMAASDPPVSAEVEAMRLPVGEGIIGSVVATGETIYSPDVTVDPRVDEAMRNTGSNVAVRSYLAVPLVTLGEVIGALQVDSPDVDAFRDEDRVLLEGLATQVAGAIESARRYEAITELEVMKSDFIARVSHELRTPITIVAGFVDTLLHNDERLDAVTRRQMLERIDVATARLTGLIDELLMLSRLEAGVVAANVEPVALAAVLPDVRRQSGRPEAVELDVPTDLVIATDRDLLVRALGLLVDNALKYAGDCRVVARERQIEVLDSGPGIPPEQRSRVFERFARANVDTTIPGMGVGLPMARTLLAAAGADLSLEDGEDGTGTRMVVRFWD